MEFTQKNRTRIIGALVLAGAAAFVTPFMVGGHSDGAGPHSTGLTFAASRSPAHAEVPTAAVTRMDTASAVNLVGRQRMLSQRMVKAYLMLGQGIAADDARAILRGSIKQFESNLATLKAFQPTARVRSVLVNLEGAWTKCKPLLAAAPEQGGCRCSSTMSTRPCRMRHTTRHWPTRVSPVRRSITWSVSRGASTCCRSAWPSSISIALGDSMTIRPRWNCTSAVRISPPS